MRFLIPLGNFLVLVIFLAIGLTLDPREVPSPFIGKPAPAFSLPQVADAGKTLRPADLLGQVYLLNVWASWCVSCRQEHPVLLELARKNVVPIYGLDYQDDRDDERLIEELRCLVCQNQSLPDSDADLARDLRDEVYGIIQAGRSEQEAIRFLTDRYGDFVLYRPPLQGNTLLLWAGPLLILAGGALFFWKQGRRRGDPACVELTGDERQRLERLKKNLEGQAPSPHAPCREL